MNLLKTPTRLFSTVVSKPLKNPPFVSVDDSLEDGLAFKLSSRMPPEEALKAQLNISELSNGMKICSYDHKGPLSTLTLVASAGSRYEDPNLPGTAHVFQRTLIRNLKGDTSIRTKLLAELRGNSLESGHTRENMFITTSFMRDDIPDTLPLIYNNLFNTEFQVHEMLRFREQIAEQTKIYNMDSQFMIMDTIHAIAFKGELGNSLLVSPGSISSIKRSTLADFRQKYVLPSRLAVIGYGVDHSDLETITSQHTGATVVEKSKKINPIKKAKYYGGQSHVYVPPNMPANLAIAFPTLSYMDKGHLASRVAVELLGTSNRLCIQNRHKTPYPLSIYTEEMGGSAYSFLNQYSDGGLIGFYVRSNPKDTMKLSLSIHSLMKKFSKEISERDMARAKASALIRFDEQMSSGIGFAHVAALNLISGCPIAPSREEYAQEIKKITVDQVKQVLVSALSAKPSMSYHGHAPLMPVMEDFKY